MKVSIADGDRVHVRTEINGRGEVMKMKVQVADDDVVTRCLAQKQSQLF